MKFYEFGKENDAVILLLPGTCCHWKLNFGEVIPLLSKNFRVVCVSYDGFDETEDAVFDDMISQTEKIEQYILGNYGRKIKAAYGCSLGGSFVALGSIVVLLLQWEQMSWLLRFNTISFIAMLVHQFEEYGFPGGEPMIMNRALQGSDIPDRYPLNQFSAMFTNVFFAHVIYLLPILFPDMIWLGIAPMLMGMMQFMVHGIMTNIKMKSIYNPGLGAVVFLHIPVGVSYIHYITKQQLASGTTWGIGIVYTVVATGFVLGYLTYIGLSDRNSKWVFDEVELKRFHVDEKLKKKNIIIDGHSQPNVIKLRHWTKSSFQRRLC